MSLPEYEDEIVYYIKRTTKSVSSRFWKMVEVKGDDDCWLWTGYKDISGYGKIGIKPRDIRFAHRVSWEMYHGKRIPNGLVICHKCDNPSCVNPNHLFLGSVADNNLDRHLKGRTKSPSNVGENNPYSLLSNKDALEIRNHLKNKTLSPKELSVKYGVALNTVYGIGNGRSWRNV